MFESDIKNSLLAAARNMLRPVVRLLVRNGINHADLVKICKALYVEVCEEDFGMDGRPTNASRIAMLSSIDRKEVKKLRDNSELDQTIQHTLNTHDKLSRILAGWHQDQDFLDTKGAPKVIPFNTPGDSPSFSLLAKRYGGDMPVRAMLKELLDSGCITAVDDEIYLPLQRVFIPKSSDPKALMRVGEVSGELLNTIFHNLYTEPNKKRERPRFERRVYNNAVSLEHAEAFSELVDEEAQALFNRLDAWLDERECPVEDQDIKRVVRLGLGAYLIHGTPTTLDINEPQ